MRLLSKEEIKDARPTPLDCGRCERGGDECKLTELDKARCWARMSAKAQAKLTESDTLKEVGERLDSHELKHELREILRAVNSIRNFGMGTAYNEYVEKIIALLRGEKPEGL